MEINSDSTGIELKGYTKTVTWRDIMNYAAAIDDANPRYFDDERDGGIIAHPMLSTAILWPMSEEMYPVLKTIGNSPEIVFTMVHYTEYIELHRPVVPGDRLRITGKIAAIIPHRAGTHLITRIDALSDGSPVFTEYGGILLRGVTCTGEGSGVDSIPTIPEYRGDNPPLWESAVHIDDMRPFIYDGCTDIVFPIHTSKRFAHQVGLPGIILQGTATLAYAVREIINREADGNPQQLKVLSCRFTGMVRPGTDIHIQLSGREADDGHRNLFFHVLNSDGQKAISRGFVRMQD